MGFGGLKYLQQIIHQRRSIPLRIKWYNVHSVTHSLLNEICIGLLSIVKYRKWVNEMGLIRFLLIFFRRQYICGTSPWCFLTDFSRNVLGPGSLQHLRHFYQVHWRKRSGLKKSTVNWNKTDTLVQDFHVNISEWKEVRSRKHTSWNANVSNTEEKHRNPAVWIVCRSW